MKRAAALAIVALCASPARAGDDDFAGASVVFARDASLWKTDPQGKGPASELVALPGSASDVRMIRSDPAGKVILFDAAGTWYWARLGADVAKPEKLPCADAPARLTPDARVVICADDDGKALLVGLVTDKVVHWPAPAAGARIVTTDGVRELIYADGDGIWAAPLKKPRERRALASEAPLRGFVAAPDGARAAAITDGHVYEKKQKVAAEVLSGFALDGKAARRTLHRDSTVIDWSWDSRWLLVQLGDEACITRATGGQYKCWSGYRAQSLAPDGTWALVLGKRKDSDDDTLSSLYRAELSGAYTERPALVETLVDGAALWLPASADR
jgi:hypothetical protein